MKIEDEIVNCINEKCSQLQPIPSEVNYFKLLESPQKFNINLNDLKKKYYKIQNAYHPDKLISMDDKLKAIFENSSMVINQAYDNLKEPLKRAEYMLRLQGKELKEEESIENQQILFNIMELNERLEDSQDKNETETIVLEVKEHLKDLETKLNIAFDNNDIKAAYDLVLEYRYYFKCLKRAKHL
ncbi:Co-chaperone Hsc20 [Neoconidiobolus thromboides FSU 785]|nr:Co-chaperone Hsc20 [Neoconidiobolus thromboides FSU 785]